MNHHHSQAASTKLLAVSRQDNPAETCKAAAAVPNKTPQKNRSICKLHRQTRVSAMSASFNSRRKSFLFGLVLVTLAFVMLPGPGRQNSVEAAKTLKTLAKTLVFQKLTQTKHFVPLPVPIPGKWHQLLNTMIDSGLLNHKSTKAVAAAAAAVADGATAIKSPTATTSNKSFASKLSSSVTFANKNNKFNSMSSDSISKKLLLFGAGNLVDELSNNSKRLNKLLSGGSGSSSPASSSTPSKVDMNEIKKLTRLAAAKYARYIITNQPVGKATTSQQNSKPGNGNPLRGTSSSSLVKRALLINGGDATISSKSVDNNSNGNKTTTGPATNRNDLLVTAFNVIKLARQITELDPSKWLSLSKKKSILMAPSSSSSQSSSSSSSSSSPGLLSMNIDNRKTLLNKMHYFHRLTYDYRHRNRRNMFKLE
jgi:hypothetical protein